MTSDLADADCVTCTDVDGDTYSIEGGPCGAVDCDDLACATVDVCIGATNCGNNVRDGGEFCDARKTV